MSRLEGRANCDRRKHLRAKAAMLLAVGVCAPAALGQASSWNSPANGNWNIAGNWSAGVPGAGSTAIIGALGPAYTVSLNLSSSVGTLLINSPSAQLTLNSSTLTLGASSVSANVGTLTTSVANIVGAAGGTASLNNFGWINHTGPAGPTWQRMILNNHGTFTFQNAGTFAGAFDNSGTVVIAPGWSATLTGGGVSTGQFTLSSNSTLNFASGYAFGAGAIVGGASNSTVIFSAGTQSINNAWNFAGTTQITGGTVVFNSSIGSTLNVSGGTARMAPDASPVLLFANNGTVDLIGGGAGTLSGGNWQFSGGASFVAPAGLITTNAATVLLDGAGVNASALNSLRINSGTLALDARDWSFVASGSFTNSGRIIRSGADFTNIPAVLNNLGTLEVTGGVVRLDGGASQLLLGALGGGHWIANNGTIDLAGQLLDSNNGTIELSGSGRMLGLETLSNNTRLLSLANGATLTLTKPLGNSATVSIGGASTLTVSGLSLTGGTVSIASDPSTPGTLVLKSNLATNASSSAARVVSTGSAAKLGRVDLGGASRTFTVANGSAAVDLIVSASLYNGSLAKAGLGVMRLDSPGDYAATTVNAGTLRAGAAGVLPSTAPLTVNLPGTFDLAGFAQTTAALNGDGAITLGGGTLSITGVGSGDFSGSISGNGGIHKSGTGAQNFASSLGFTGGFSINNGTVTISSVGTYTADISVGTTTSGFGVLNVGADGHLGNAANTVKLDGGMLRITGSFTSPRNFEVNSGTIETPGQIVLSTGLAGGGTFHKSGAGILRLDAAGGFAGDVRVHQGRLTLQGGLATLPNATSFNVSEGATLRLNQDVPLGPPLIRDRAGGPPDMHFGGGTVTLVGQDNQFFEQVFGTMYVDSGASTLQIIEGRGNGTTKTWFSGTSRTAGATLDIVAADLGTINVVKFTGSFPSGFMGSWLTLNGSDFAKYHPTDGIIPLAASDYEDGFSRGKHVLLTASASVPTALPDPFNILTLTLDASNNPVNVSIPASTTLELTEGGLIKRGSSSSSVGSGTVTSGTSELNLTVDAGTLSMGAALSGFATLTKRGSGTLLFSAATGNSFSTAIVMEGAVVLEKPGGSDAIPGNLLILGGSVLSSSNNQIDDSSVVTLDAGSFNLQSHSETIARLANNGGSVLTSGGTLNVTGSVRMGGGTTTITGRLNTGSGSVQVSGGNNSVGVAALLSSGSGSMVFDQPDAGISIVSNPSNPGQIVLGGDIVATNLSGTTFITTDATDSSAGVLDLGAAARNITVALGTAPADFQIDARVTNGTLVKRGDGTLKLTNINTYAGGSRVIAGTLEASNSALGSGSVQFGGTGTTSVGTLALRTATANGSFSTNNLVAFAVDRPVKVDMERTGGGLATFFVNDATVGETLSITGFGTLAMQDLLLITTAAQVTTILNYNTSVRISGTISGAGGLQIGPSLALPGPIRGQIRNGTLGSIGTVSIDGTGSNTYGGTTQINAGTTILAMTGGPAIPGDLTINAGSVILGADEQIADDAIVSLTGIDAVFDLNGFGETITALSLTGGRVLLNGGTLTVLGDAARGLVPAMYSVAENSIPEISGAGQLVIGAANPTLDIADGALGDDLSISSTVVSSGVLMKLGDGNLVLGGSNLITGTVSINAGTLTAAATDALGTAVIELNGGALQLRGIGSIPNPISLGPGGVIDVPVGQTATYANQLTGTSGLTKTGGGTLVLAAPANLFSGTVNLAAGTISISNDAQLGEPANTLSLVGSLHASASVNMTRPIVLGGGDFDVAAGQTLTLAPGPFTGAAGLSKTGPGTLIVQRAIGYAGPTTVSDGSLVFSGGLGTLVSGSTLVGGNWIVQGTGNLNLGMPAIITNQASITLRGTTGTMSGINALQNNQGHLRLEQGRGFTATGAFTNSGTISVGAGSVLRVNGTPANNGTIEVSGSLIVDYTGDSPVAMIGGQVAAGHNLGGWNGPGINSLEASISTSPRLMLGYADNSDLGLATFAGQPVDATSVLVRVTYDGDANLDGQVDISDLARLATNWQAGGSWAGGDFDYTGFVDISDLARIATNWQVGVGAPLAVSFEQAAASLGLPRVAVPEPAALALPALACFMARRRRSA